MKLEEATEGDIDVLVDFWYSLATGMEQYSELNEVAYDGAAEVPEDGFREHLRSDEVTEYLVVEDGDAIGFLTVREGTHPSRAYRKYLHVVNLFIAEEYRGEGRGSEVIERVKDLARANDCDHLTVSCEWDNDGARRFYRDNGFVEKQVTFAQKL